MLRGRICYDLGKEKYQIRELKTARFEFKGWVLICADNELNVLVLQGFLGISACFRILYDVLKK